MEGKASIPSLSFTARTPPVPKGPPSCQSLSRGVGSSASSIRDVVVVVVVVYNDDGRAEAFTFLLLTLFPYLKMHYTVIVLYFFHPLLFISLMSNLLFDYYVICFHSFYVSYSGALVGHICKLLLLIVYCALCHGVTFKLKQLTRQNHCISLIKSM